ncbi:MAG: hypothetical protein GQ574_10550 [Crocinitomix sp.]|nr:hypothetical protein [Crocinitomix sp.]
MQNENYSFLSERITDSNIETDLFLLNSDPIFVTAPQADDLKRDELLLKFKQRVWEIPDNYCDELTPYYSIYYDEIEDNTSFFMHDMIYQDQFKNRMPLEDSLSCKPTLSFRTLIYDSNSHIKFGIPLFYGKMMRLNSKNEVLTSLYLSDYIQSLPKIKKLDFFMEFKGYSMLNLENFSVSYRKRECLEEIIPVSCYFNKILNHSNGNASDRLERTFHFLSNFFHDFNGIYQDLKLAGLGLEIHGQNLLIKLDAEGISKGEYVYRDLGNCTIETETQKKQTSLNDYYKSNYTYDFDASKLADSNYYIWQNYRTFFLCFFIYNLNEFVVREKLRINVYTWFEKMIEELPEIKGIYCAE